LNLSGYIPRSLLRKPAECDDLYTSQLAAGLLFAALEDGDPQVFLLALRDVAEARGIGRLSEETRLKRESMYRMLSKQGNPRLTSLDAVLNALGLRLGITMKA
jgi:probable addiction module antidote protein